MTFEDFFSLTNMKDGLTDPSRVEELVSIMQKEKDTVVKNIRDATRQWAAVASALAATENRDCLDRFIELDGLGFIDRWLKQVQKFGNNTNEGFVEESITSMLGALQKLHIDYELSISSGIWITIESLLCHNSALVQDRARGLFDSWNQGRVNESHDNDVKSVESSQDDDVAVGSIHVNESSRMESSAFDVPLPNASVNEESNGAEPAGEKILPSECLLPQKMEDIQTKSNNNELLTHAKVDNTDMEDKPLDHVATTNLCNSVPENLSMEHKISAETVETISSFEAFGSPPQKQCCKEEQSDALVMNELSNDEKHFPKVSSFPEKVCETASASTSKVEPRIDSSAVDVASAHDIMTGPAVGKKIDAHEVDLDAKATAIGEVRKLASEPKNGMNDMVVVNNCSTPVFKSVGEDTVEDDDCHSGAIGDYSGNKFTFGKPKDLETSFSRIRSIGAADRDKDHVSDGGSDSRNDFLFSKATMAIQNHGAPNRRVSDIELDYGIVDALEVARKVAQEYREQSCSSDEKILGGRIRPPESPDSVNEKEDQADELPSKEVATEQNYSAEGDGQSITSDNRENEPESGIADMDSSQVTEAAQEPEVNRDKGLCDFDLNQEVCSDDLDNPIDPVNHVSAPVSVVSASRPSLAPALPAAPLQFEGRLGWKGTAATSAFRPASPRRLFDSDKITLTVGGTNNSSKQRQDCLDIDLNVAESGDEKLPDLIPEKQIPLSSGHHSAESSLEVSPRRSERLNLDLNRISDDSDPLPSDLRMEKRLIHNWNSQRSPSPASSSSSMMQPFLRNFDLNDRPFLHNDSLDQGPYHGKSFQNVNAFGLPKLDDPVISIMGARVEVNRKEFISQLSSLRNGNSLETAMDGNLARSGSVLGLGPPPSYTNSTVFGYNGFATASPSYSSAMYGPGSTIPYMVDLRGAPVLPQIMGSATAVPPSYSQPSPFMMSMTGAPSAMNGVSRPNFDLNSGFPTEGGNRDNFGSRQLFLPSQGRSTAEHLRASSQPSSSSGVGGKRKEPDGGWELYPLNYRNQQQQQHPWNQQV